MPDVGDIVPATTRAQWRAWLTANHATATEAWLIAYTKASKKPCVAYDDAVEEALCFGWIDSIVKKVGGDARAQRYTPRRPASPVSELNRARVRKLVQRRLMTAAGLQNLPGVETWLEPPPLVVPGDIERALRRGNAWDNFQAFPEDYRRIRVGWVDGARVRPDEFDKRLAYLVRMTQRGKMYGTLP